MPKTVINGCLSYRPGNSKNELLKFLKRIEDYVNSKKVTIDLSYEIMYE